MSVKSATARGLASGLEPAMVLLTTQNFSAVSSVSVDDVFSATYDNYKLIITCLGSGFNDGRIRFRVGGVDASGNDYKVAGQYQSSASAVWQNAGASEGVSFALVANYNSSTETANYVEIGTPFLTAKTNYIADVQQNGASSLIIRNTGVYNLTTSFTGFTLLTSAGTITGRVSVYGYNK